MYTRSATLSLPFNIALPSLLHRGSETDFSVFYSRPLVSKLWRR